jgi:hypothetical protein
MTFESFAASFEDLENYPSEQEGQGGFRMLQIEQEHALRPRPYLVLRYSGRDHLPSPDRKSKWGVIGWEIYVDDIDDDDPEGLARSMLDVAYEPVGRPPDTIDVEWHQKLTEWIVQRRMEIAATSDE